MQSTMQFSGNYQERKVTRLRTVKLSQAECADLGLQAGDLVDVYEKSKQEAKDAEAKLDKVLAQLKKKTKDEDRECTMRIFADTRTVQVFDGEEMIEERALEESELQLDAFEPKHGVVEDDDQEDFGELTKEDLEETMRAERSPNKPSLVDL